MFWRYTFLPRDPFTASKSHTHTWYTCINRRWPKHKSTIYLLADHNATELDKARKVSWASPGNWHGSWEEKVGGPTGIRTLTLRFNSKWPVETTLRTVELTWTPGDVTVAGVGQDGRNNVITMHKEAVWLRKNGQWRVQSDLGRATCSL